MLTMYEMPPGWEEVEERAKARVHWHSRASCATELPSGPLGFGGMLQGENFRGRSQDRPVEQLPLSPFGRDLQPRKTYRER